jgi:hypothetical protein
VITKYAGQDQNTDLHNIVIRRGEQIRWSPADVQSALSEGLTIDQLQLLPGDEVQVGARHSAPWATIAQIGVTVLSAILVQAIVRR